MPKPKWQKQQEAAARQERYKATAAKYAYLRKPEKPVQEVSTRYIRVKEFDRHQRGFCAFYIQPGKWTGNENPMGVFSLIELRPLWNAHFEGGALQQSIRRMNADLRLDFMYVHGIKIWMLGINQWACENLRMLQNLMAALDLRGGGSHTSERIYMLENLLSEGVVEQFREDVWWDIANDFFVSTNVDRLKQLKAMLENGGYAP